MNVKERIKAIRLMDKVKRNPQFAEEIGLVSEVKTKKETNIIQKR
ncbi:hypothetical protein [Faecalicatena contorta]|nr:hypothetical protein [Faecalicatena contorta]